MRGTLREPVGAAVPTPSVKLTLIRSWNRPRGPCLPGAPAQSRRAAVWRAVPPSAQQIHAKWGRRTP